MTENKSLAGVDSPAPAAEAEQAPVGKPAAARSNGLPLVVGLIALLLAIGLAVAAYFIWHEVGRLGRDQAGVQMALSDRIQPLRASLDGVNRALKDERAAFEARSDALAEDQQSLANRVNVLAAMMGRSERGWTLAEVEYLLRIANQRLQLQRDTHTARQALQAADGRLRDMADPHYLNVREQLAHDLDKLRAVPVVDVDGLSLALSSALDNVDALPVAGSRYQAARSTPAPAGENGKTTAASLAEFGKLLWRSLADVFRLREHDKPVRPMLPPEREYFLRENLRLQLAAARLALLRNDAGQFRQALETADGWLLSYFDKEAASVQALDAQLKRLAGTDIMPALPDVSGALRLLQQQIQLSEQPAVLPVVPEGSPPDSRAAPPPESQLEDVTGATP